MLSVILSMSVLLIGYLLGSVCSAVVVSRVFELPDPRTSGSKNPGATNVLRLSGKKYAALVLVVDMLKGLLPVVLAKLLGLSVVTISFTCLAAVLGHMFPIFFQFRGGKGVATALGSLLGLHFVFGVVLIAIWAVVAKYTRYSSLASLVSLGAAPILTLFFTGSFDAFAAVFLIMLFVFYKHRSNINRLVEGQESKI